MKKPAITLFSLVLALATAAAFAQAPTRVRGTITAVQGEVLSVKSRDGKDLKVELAPDARVGTSKRITLADLKTGTYIGVTAMKAADGKLTAVQVSTIPPQAPAGHTPWDSAPGATMTNANLTGMAKVAGGNEITLEVKGQSYRILVPESATIHTTETADRSALKVGEYVFAVGPADPSTGVIKVRGVTVSKGGFRSPQ
jgi:hypothetical protein